MGTALRYGLIGAGMMGQEHLRNIAYLGNTHITGFVEPDNEMAQKTKSIVPNAKHYQSIEELLHSNALDALVIASPNHCHAEQLVQIATTRPLPLLLEKPACVCAAELAQIRTIAANYPTPIWVAMEYRYMPAIAQFCAQVHKTVGDIKMLTIREHRFPFLTKVGDWNRFNHNTGGTFVEKCCHFFDLMRYILQSDPVRVFASGGQAINHLHETYDGQVPDILDHGYVIVDFATGARAMLELSMFAEASEYQELLSAIGPMGKLECFVPGPARFWPKHVGPLPEAKLIASTREPQQITTMPAPVDKEILDLGDHNGATYYQHLKFQSMLRCQNTPEVSLVDGLWAVKMGLAAEQSISTRQAIEINGL